ncbi:MAG: GNAT family N-acetyltransferase [Phycisphaerae bacterium]
MIYDVQFPSLRFVEFPNARAFQIRVGPWMTLREGENCHLLGLLPDLAAANGSDAKPRFLAVQDRDEVVAAAVLFPSGSMVATWATREIIDVLLQGLASTNSLLNGVYAPGHVSKLIAKLWAQRTGQEFVLDREERLYQLAYPTHTPAAEGRLEVATPADRDLALAWTERFSREVKLETGSSTVTEQVDELIKQQCLYLWKQPEPVAMAAWVCQTPHGGCINFVYTPPEARGRGHGKDVTTALGQRMLQAGNRFCFILTDCDDPRTNALYQRIGGRTLCEFVRCKIEPAKNGTQSQAAASGKPRLRIEIGR